MSLSNNSQIWIASSDELTEGICLKKHVIFLGDPASILIFRSSGKVYAYLNRCVHMPRTLDCEQEGVFDSTGHLLRCSMHGIVYDPETGASLSTLCNGQHLTAIRLVQDEKQSIWIRDKRVKPLMPS